MTALAQNSPHLVGAVRGKTRSFVIKNSTTLYIGGLVGLDSNGLLVAWADTAGIKFLGQLVAFQVPNTSTGANPPGNTSATPPTRGIVDVSGAFLNNVDVTGVSARTSLSDQVYCTTDNPTDLTLTPTTNVRAIGWLADFRSASDMDVQCYTPAEYLVPNNILSGTALTDNSTGTASSTIAAGVGLQWHVFPWTFTTSTAAIDVKTALVLGYKFKIVKWCWIDGGVLLVGASGSRVANMEIGTTDVGTVPSTVTVVQAGTAFGRKIDGTTVTGANTGSATDTFSIEIASGGTDITAGNGEFHVLFQNMDTADAIASIVAKLNPLFL